ncbi:hypothetical protein [Actinoplanes sp. CA-252034]|uniref:hypothetical protein n=1 Tax=Actinoplanes sp. CA-252034 TaxID=3239906 RepID=UPI003D964089
MAAPSDPPSLTPLFLEPEPPEPIPQHPSGPSPAGPPAPASADRPDTTPAPPDRLPATPAPPDRPAAPPAPPAPPGLSALAPSDPAASAIPLVVVDGANVVGSVPDGWWRDRAGAAVRLRDRLAEVSTAGLPDVPGPVEVTLVVEGKARDIPQDPGGVRVERASGSGDDKIVDLVRETAATRRTIVVTADRGLRNRVIALGAEVRGPSSVPR